jgi:poly(A) polymerase Pap1
MDYSISYHPISEEQMKIWYFDVFEDLGTASELSVRIPTEQVKNNSLSSLETFYKEKYIEMIKRSRNLDYEDFNKWHGYFLAIVQGFFDKFFFVQGAALSAIHDMAFHKKYITNWEDVIPSDYIEDLHYSSKLNGEFSAGVYLSATQVAMLLNDYENDDYIKDLLDEQFEGQKITVFLASLKYAKENNQGLLEASRVIEQSEQVFEEPSCYSNIFNCDVMSAAVYTTELAAHYDSIYKGTGE